MDKEIKERLEADKQALRKLLSKNHAKAMEGMAGGAAMCVCGQGCGGTPECGAYAVLLMQLENCITTLESISGGTNADFMIRRANAALKDLGIDGY